MTLSCVHIVQYLCVEGGVAWEFIEYDVLNPSDSIPKREHLRVMLKFTKVKPRLPSYQGLFNMGDKNNRQLTKNKIPFEITGNQ